MEFIDIHSHYAWDIDDGISSLEDAKTALAKAQAQGIKQIVATPHIIPETTTNLCLIKQRIKEFIELAKKHEKKNGQIMYPIRVALTFKAFTPGGAVEIAHILGKDETIKRIKNAIEKLEEIV